MEKLRHIKLEVMQLLACVAGVKRGRGRGNLGAQRRRERKGSFPLFLARPTRSRAPKFPLPLPLLTPAMQAMQLQVENIFELQYLNNCYWISPCEVLQS